MRKLRFSLGAISLASVAALAVPAASSAAPPAPAAHVQVVAGGCMLYHAICPR